MIKRILLVYSQVIKGRNIYIFYVYGLSKKIETEIRDKNHHIQVCNNHRRTNDFDNFLAKPIDKYC